MFSNLKILIAESVGCSRVAVDILRQLGDVELADLKFDELWAAAPDFDILWVRLRHRISGVLMDHAPRLRVIATPTTGLSHIDLEAASTRGIRVFSLRGETDFLQNIRATAEHTIALMLGVMRHLPAATASVQNGAWDRDQFKGSELYGKTMGIVGYGRVGRIVAGYLRAFGARVIVTDPRLAQTPGSPDVEAVSLNDLLTQADLVSVHVDLNERTHNLFGWAEFRRIKTGAWFVNTSRGELIVEEALLWALESGRLSGAALDVLKGEQGNQATQGAIAQYARKHRHLLITPHIGGCTFESMAKTEIFLAGKIVAGLLTQPEKPGSGSRYAASV